MLSFEEENRVRPFVLFVSIPVNDYLTVAHKVYGIPQTINAANYVYFLALRELILLRRDEVEGPDVDNIAIGEALSLCSYSLILIG